MTNLNLYLTKFMNNILKIFFSLILIASIIIFFANIIGFNVGTIIFAIVFLIALYSGYKVINSNISTNLKISLLIFISAVIRILWIVSNNSYPASDFEIIYDFSELLINGDTSIFKGTAYIGRFPHLTILTLYMALMRYLFPVYNLAAMKIVNLSFNLFSLLLIYLIIKELFKNEKLSLISLLISSIFPPFVTYMSVFCSENLAIFFYLLSIYLFLKGIASSKTHYFILCSISLAIGNLFRMVAVIVLIAYSIYLLIYYKDKIFKKTLKLLCTILPYIIIMVSVSTSLQKANITEYPLWHGSEPKITNVLKGTNINSLGMWNTTDAEFVDNNLGDYESLENDCKEIILQRLTSTNPVLLAGFYVVKVCAEWCLGDFCGALWTQSNMISDNPLLKVHFLGSMSFQFIYIIMLFLSFISLFNHNLKKNYPQINLFYLILCGYIAAYILTENQARYSYIVSWLFIILSTSGLMNFKYTLLHSPFKKLIKIGEYKKM